MERVAVCLLEVGVAAEDVEPDDVAALAFGKRDPERDDDAIVLVVGAEPIGEVGSSPSAAQLALTVHRQDGPCERYVTVAEGDEQTS